jgi:hypothetical protein
MAPGLESENSMNRSGSFMDVSGIIAELRLVLEGIEEGIRILEQCPPAATAPETAVTFFADVGTQRKPIPATPTKIVGSILICDPLPIARGRRAAARGIPSRGEEVNENNRLAG